MGMTNGKTPWPEKVVSLAVGNAVISLTRYSIQEALGLRPVRESREREKERHKKRDIETQTEPMVKCISFFF